MHLLPGRSKNNVYLGIRSTYPVGLEMCETKLGFYQIQTTYAQHIYMHNKTLRPPSLPT